MHTAFGQPLPRRLPGVGLADLSLPCCCICKPHTMVNVFVGWSTALVNCQYLFLRKETDDKWDDTFLCQYSTKLIKIKCYKYCKLEFLERPCISASSRKSIHLDVSHICGVHPDAVAFPLEVVEQHQHQIHPLLHHNGVDVTASSVLPWNVQACNLYVASGPSITQTVYIVPSVQPGFGSGPSVMGSWYQTSVWLSSILSSRLKITDSFHCLLNAASMIKILWCQWLKLFDDDAPPLTANQPSHQWNSYSKHLTLSPPNWQKSACTAACQKQKRHHNACSPLLFQQQPRVSQMLQTSTTDDKPLLADTQTQRSMQWV